MPLPPLAGPGPRLQVEGDPEALFWFTLEPVLTEAECAAVIRWAEDEGLAEAPIHGVGGAVRRPEVRNNVRVMVDDPAFAAALWTRMAPVVTAPSPRGARPVGLNERLRIYRYDPGMYFKPHTDGAFVRPDGSARSLQTVMVYLDGDGDLQGGETRFYDADRIVVPRPGLACVFWHRQLHEGCAVRAGRKYALRTDVMYAEPARSSR